MEIIMGTAMIIMGTAMPARSLPTGMTPILFS